PFGSSVVYTAAAFNINEIPGVRPFAYSAPAVTAASNASDAIAKLAIDPLGAVVVEHAGALPAGDATVRVTRRDAGDVELRVDASAAATITVLQSYARGWTASVDGTATDVMPADGLFQAIVVPPGQHVVQLRYEPGSVTQGIAVSLGTLAV